MLMDLYSSVISRALALERGRSPSKLLQLSGCGSLALAPEARGPTGSRAYYFPLLINASNPHKVAKVSSKFTP
jgi:hypothetical protein